MLTRVGTFIADKVERRGNFLSPEQISNLEEIFGESEASLEAAVNISKISAHLTEQATQFIVKKFLAPDSLASSENIYIISNFIKLFLRSISYSVTSGEVTVNDEYILNGFRETITALGQSCSWYVEALKFIMQNHGLEGKSARILDSHLNYVISALE
jgi:phycocyanin alpha chain